MTPFRVRLTLLLLPLSLGASSFALAQEIVQQPTPTADALAEQVRILAAQPRDVGALITAGELSTQLNDPAAALAFFGRAQSIEPTNPRIAAGRAGAMVLLERPGEALRLYQLAERAGVAMTPYLAQRGFAYDLTGQPGYAQRDYRAALAVRRDDETVRRLALSLGISGRRDEAMALLDPLLRRSDRGAWRARACILAMTGDVAGAERIATAMMPGGAALGPFLRRLEGLSVADRAFAVHFGNVSASVARANDARLAPAVASLPTEPVPVAQVAPQLAAVTPRAEPRNDRRSRRERTATPAPGVGRVALAEPSLPAPPGLGAGSGSTAIAMVPSAPTHAPAPYGSTPGAVVTAATANMTIITPPRGGQRQMSAEPVVRTPAPTPASSDVARRVAAQPATTTTRQSDATPAPVTRSGWAATADAAPVRIVPPVSTSVVVAPPPPPPSPSPSPTPAPTPVVVAAVEAQPTLDTPPVTVASPPIEVASAPTPEPNPAPQPVVAAPPPPPAPRVSAIDSIVGAIAIPAEELEVRPPRTVPTVAKPPVETPEVRKPELKKPDPKKPEVAKVDPKKAKADAAKAEAAKKEKAKPDPAKAEPARWWAQVAGGARVADLPKDWRRVVAKSPAAFRGKGAWTTPLRATNRLLAGPFKSGDEAQAFVNTIGKDGLSGFAWQSEAGQKIDRLAVK